MVTRIQMTNVIRCDVDTFWSAFLDEELTRRIFLTELGFPSYRLSQTTGEAGRVQRRIEIAPKLNMPTTVKKVIGERFHYVEVGELDAGVYRFELQPPARVPADKASGEGVMRVVATNEGWTQCTIELSIDVRMFGLGGMLESFAVKAAQEAYAAHATAMNAALARRS